MKDLIQGFSKDDKADYEERAGLLQYEGGISREEAEREALRMILRKRYCAIPQNCEMRENTERCLACLNRLRRALPINQRKT